MTVLSLAAASLAVACGSNATTGNGGGVAADAQQGGTDASGTDASAAGDNTKNSADLKVTDDSSKAVTIKAEKPADKGDVTTKAWGATNAGKMLNLFMTDVNTNGNTVVISIFVNTEKYPLPATNIPLGEPNSDAWVTYVSAGAVTGSFSSKDKGTLDVTPCPADGKALVGTLKGAVLPADLPTGPKTQTLEGTFNLVFWAGSGALKCEAKKPPVTTGDKSKVSAFTPPAASTCDANPCNGGLDATSNCCPYGKCISDCIVVCTTTMSTCIQACATGNPLDIATCMQGCATKVQTCNDACPATCGASGQCQTAMKSLNTCWGTNSATCGDISTEDAQRACYFNACCAEVKAAF